MPSQHPKTASGKFRDVAVGLSQFLVFEIISGDLKTRRQYLHEFHLYLDFLGTEED